MKEKAPSPKELEALQNEAHAWVVYLRGQLTKFEPKSYERGIIDQELARYEQLEATYAQALEARRRGRKELAAKILAPVATVAAIVGIDKLCGIILDRNATRFIPKL